MKRYRLIPRFSAEEIQHRLDELALQINRDYEGESLLLVGVLKGCFVFLADLIRRLSVPLEIDFVRLSSYGSEAESSGEIQITKDLELSIEGKHVLVVEDIVDTGTTLAWFLKRLERYGPKSVKACVLIDKAERRQQGVSLDYVGVRVEKGFLVGYGLDFSEKYRNLPGINEVEFID